MNKTSYTDPELENDLREVPQKTRREIDLSLGIVYRIHEILQRKGWSQADFAKAAGKSEAEISKWMSGSQNFTIRTLALIESTLEEDILSIKKYRKTVAGYELSEVRRRYLSENSTAKYGKRK